MVTHFARGNGNTFLFWPQDMNHSSWIIVSTVQLYITALPQTKLFLWAWRLMTSLSTECKANVGSLLKSCSSLGESSGCLPHPVSSYLWSLPFNNWQTSFREALWFVLHQIPITEKEAMVWFCVTSSSIFIWCDFWFSIKSVTCYKFTLNGKSPRREASPLLKSQPSLTTLTSFMLQQDALWGGEKMLFVR